MNWTRIALCFFAVVLLDLNPRAQASQLCQLRSPQPSEGLPTWSTEALGLDLVGPLIETWRSKFPQRAKQVTLVGVVESSLQPRASIVKKSPSDIVFPLIDVVSTNTQKADDAMGEFAHQSVDVITVTTKVPLFRLDFKEDPARDFDYMAFRRFLNRGVLVLPAGDEFPSPLAKGKEMTDAIFAGALNSKALIHYSVQEPKTELFLVPLDGPNSITNSETSAVVMASAIGMLRTMLWDVRPSEAREIIKRSSISTFQKNGYVLNMYRLVSLANYLNDRGWPIRRAQLIDSLKVGMMGPPGMTVSKRQIQNWEARARNIISCDTEFLNELRLAYFDTLNPLPRKLLVQAYERIGLRAQADFFKGLGEEFSANVRAGIISSDTGTRLSAVRALGDWSSEEAVTHLKTVLSKADDPEVRRTALHALNRSPLVSARNFAKSLEQQTNTTNTGEAVGTMTINLPATNLPPELKTPGPRQ